MSRAPWIEPEPPRPPHCPTVGKVCELARGRVSAWAICAICGRPL